MSTKKNDDTMHACESICEDALHYLNINDRLKQEKACVLLALKHIDPLDIRTLWDAIPSTMQKDKDIVTAAVKANPNLLFILDDSYQEDFDIIKTAINTDSSALRFAGTQLRDNKSLVILALSNAKTAIAFYQLKQMLSNTCKQR